MKMNGTGCWKHNRSKYMLWDSQREVVFNEAYLNSCWAPKLD